MAPDRGEGQNDEKDTTPIVTSISKCGTSENYQDSNFPDSDKTSSKRNLSNLDTNLANAVAVASTSAQDFSIIHSPASITTTCTRTRPILIPIRRKTLDNDNDTPQ